MKCILLHLFVYFNFWVQMKNNVYMVNVWGLIFEIEGLKLTRV